MKKQKTLAVLSAVIFLAVFFCISAAAAQEAEQPQSVVVLATVNAYDPKIISQSGSNFKLSLDIHNRTQAQPDIKYSVQLVTADNDPFIISEKVYPEVLSLNEGQMLKKEIDYAAPDYLKGDFLLRIVAKSGNGLMFFISDFGKVALGGSGEYVSINEKSCYLTVSGAGSTRYNPVQGVDISADEVLIAVCEAINKFSRKITAVPDFETRWRTTFGKTVEDEGPNQSAVTFDPGEKKTVSVILPKAKAPQAYDAILSFKENGKAVSNEAVFHYVLRGPSATIQNFIFNKDYYLKGEKAGFMLAWTASADNFPGSRAGEKTETGRMSVEVFVRDGSGKACAQTSSVLPNEISANLESLVERDCYNPGARVTLKSQDEKILDSRDFNLISSVEAPAIQTPKETGSENVRPSRFGPKFFLIAVVLALFAISLILIVKKRKNNAAVGLWLALFLFGGMFFSDTGARAETVSLNYNGVSLQYVLSLDRLAYAPNQAIQVSRSGSDRGSFWYEVCDSPWNDCMNHAICGTVTENFSSQVSAKMNTLRSQTYSSSSISAVSVPMGVSNFTASSVGGDYNAAFRISVTPGRNIIRYLNIPYRVIPAPTVDLKVNGSDGPFSVSAPANLNLSWTTTNSTGLSGCVASWDGQSKAIPAGSQMLNGITVGSYTYALTCNVTTGGTISDSVLVTVRPCVPTYPPASYYCSPQTNCSSLNCGTAVGNLCFKIDATCNTGSVQVPAGAPEYFNCNCPPITCPPCPSRSNTYKEVAP